MSPGPLKIARVFDESVEQVTLAEHEHVVEALAAHTTQEAFAERIGSWGPHRCFQHPRADAASRAVEFTSVLVVAIIE